MKRIVHGLLWADYSLLLVARHAVDFCVEWVGCTQRQIERALIVACGAQWVVWIAGVPQRSFGWRVTMLALQALALMGLMWQYRESDRQRALTLLDARKLIARTSTWYLVLMQVPQMAVPPHRWQDWLILSGWVTFAAARYVMSLPRGGEPGKRRKLALAKLKEMFGSAWMPAPEPV